MRREARNLAKQDSKRSQREREMAREAMDIVGEHGSAIPVSEYINLEELAFRQGSHLMTNKQCKLPEGSLTSAIKQTTRLIPSRIVPKEPQGLRGGCCSRHARSRFHWFALRSLSSVVVPLAYFPRH